MRSIIAILSRLARATIALTRGPEFACGDCEFNERCGLPPAKDCIARAEQIERDGARPVRRRMVIGV
jgi:hypothetical protein